MVKTAQTGDAGGFSARGSGRGTKGYETDGGSPDGEPAASDALPLGELRERLAEYGDRLVRLIRERPVTSLVVALGAGYLVGRLLRA